MFVLEYVVFYTASLVLYIEFLQIARKWKHIMRNWYEMDTVLYKYCGKIKFNHWQKAHMACVTISIISSVNKTL